MNSEQALCMCSQSVLKHAEKIDCKVHKGLLKQNTIDKFSNAILIKQKRKENNTNLGTFIYE